MNLPIRQAARFLCFPRQPPGIGPAVAGVAAGVTAEAPWRRRERPQGAALKPYRKFAHGQTDRPGCGNDRGMRLRLRMLSPYWKVWTGSCRHVRMSGILPRGSVASTVSVYTFYAVIARASCKAPSATSASSVEIGINIRLVRSAVAVCTNADTGLPSGVALVVKLLMFSTAAAI